MNWTAFTRIEDFERACVDYFLSSKDGVLTDIQSFELNGTTLAFACGGVDTDAESVELAFREALLADPYLLYALRNGPIHREIPECPGYFVYLILTLIIDGLLDGVSTTEGAFRAKLAAWLGIDNTFSDLHGVAAMWIALREWLDFNHTSGKFRKLILPDPGGWSQIGYTRRLSFPNRRDLRLIEDCIQEFNLRTSDPLHVIRIVEPYLHANHASFALDQSFQEFCQAYYQQHRAIADHRFWRLFIRARSGAKTSTRHIARLEMVTYDGTFEFAIDNVAGERMAFASLEKATEFGMAVESDDLGKSVRKGVIIFRQIGFGKWEAVEQPSYRYGEMMVALEQMHRLRVPQLGGCELVGGWYMSKTALTPTKVEGLLAKLKLSDIKFESIFRPKLTNGVSVYGTWLGRPRFFPIIDGDGSDVRIRRLDQSQQCELSSIDGRELHSSGPIRGNFILEPKAIGTGQFAPWRVLMKFDDRAVPHRSLTSRRSELDKIVEWTEVPGTERCTSTLPSRGEVEESRLDDLLEAIYASGARGFEESDLLGLCQRTSGEFEQHPWDLLRCLHDGGTVVPRLRKHWRGRVWTLQEPKIYEVETLDDRRLLLFEGALCSRQLDRLNSVVSNSGGTFFRSLGTGEWSVPSVGAVDVDPIAIQRIMQWAIQSPELPAMRQLSFIATKRSGEFYRPVAYWNFELGKFVAAECESSVQLVRLAHPSREDHDIYQIRFGKKTVNYVSRDAAIIVAHSLARRPMFRWNGLILERTISDGGLVEPLARSLRRRTQKAAGLKDGKYTYAIASDDVQWLSNLLPYCIDGITTVENSILRHSEVRRSLGRNRYKWVNGRLE